MQRNSTAYTFRFAAIVCVVCSVLVSLAFVALKSRQDRNVLLDRQKKVLQVAGLMEKGENLSREEVQTRFENKMVTKIVNLDSGTYVPESEIDPQAFDQQRAAKDPAMSEEAPRNPAQVQRIPKYAKVYEVLDEGELEMVVLPIEGMGLWGTLYGYLAVDKDGTTIRGITFYEHKETPGLGAEVENPAWQAKWPNRRIYDDSGNVAIRVVKGSVGPPSDAPHRVDGLAGATITSRGVTNLLALWMGENGFKPFLNNLGTEES